MKRYWYFVSSCDFGDKMTLKPRTPYYKASTEPDTKRICVAPSAAHCMSALPLGNEDEVFVYRTVREVTGRTPHGVTDTDITQEHWLTTPTRFVKVDKLSISKVKWKSGPRGDIPGSSCFDIQKKDKKNIMRWAKKRDARLVDTKLSNQKWSNLVGEKK